MSIAHPRGKPATSWFARAFLAVALLGASLAPLVVSAEGGDDDQVEGNIKTFKTLGEGYCYDSKYARGAWEFTSKFTCNTTGGVLLAKFDCQKSYQTDQGNFCASFKVNDRFKKADAEFVRKEILRRVRARYDSVIKAKEILTSLGYYDGPALFGFDSSFTEAINVFWSSNPTNSLEEPIRTDTMGRSHLSTAVIKALDEASDGYCFSAEQDEALKAAPVLQKGWCAGSASVRYAHRASAADCTARKGFFLPKDACRTSFGATCKVLSFAGAATFLHEAKGEKEVHFASDPKQCILQSGVLFAKKDCAQKVETTALLRHGYCRQIRAEARSSLKARWLAAKAFCYRGESQLGFLVVPRSECTDAGGIVLGQKDCGSFAGTTTRRCLALSAAGNQRVKAVLASRNSSGNAKVASLPEINKQAEEETKRKAEATRIAAKEKKQQQESVDVDPLVGVWKTSLTTLKHAVQGQVFLAIKSKGGSGRYGRYEALKWEKHERVPQGIDGKWYGSKKCGGVGTSDPFQSPFFLHIVDNKITHVASGSSRFTTTKIGSGGISIKGNYKYKTNPRKYISYWGMASINSAGGLTISGSRGPRQCKVSLQREWEAPVFVKRTLRNLTLSKQPDGRIRWDATSVEAFGAGKRMGYLEIIPNTVRPRLTAHGFIQGKKLSFISFENQQQALANIPPEYKAAFTNMFESPSDPSQLAQTSTPPQKSADVPSEPQITPQMVTKVQQALAFLGFYKGDIDGKAGPATEGAVKQWLLKNQITGPAEITPELADRLVANAKAEKAQRKALAIAKAKKQAEEEAQQKAEATRVAAEKKQKEQAEKQRQLKLAQAEAEEQKQADTAQKQAAKEQHAQQLAASRSRLFEGILKVRTLMQENPDYPQKAGVNEILNLAITRLSLNDLAPLEETEAMLAGVVHDIGIYEERQAEKAQRKALAIAKAKKQAEEEAQQKAEATRVAAEKKQKEQAEKQRQLKLAQAEAEEQKQADTAQKQAAKEQQKAEATRVAAEKKQQEQAEKQRQLKLAQAEAEEQKQADTAQKQAAKEQHAQQLAASRSRLFEGILKVRTLMQENPDYPQKAGVNEILNLAITRLSLNDLAPLEETEAMLAGVVHDIGIYEERQAEIEHQRQLAEAKAKKQAEEEKQRQLKLAQAEAEEQKQAELAALEKTDASTTELPPLEPMDKVFVVQQTTNIRTEPKVLAARAGRVASGDTLTILAKVSGQDWYLVETDNGERGFVFAKALASTSGQQESAAETAKSPAVPKIDFGKYYALVIGNNTYRALPDLQSAVNDARAVAALLESDYGFEVELLTNATRSETYSSLARIRRKVAAKDNLLIYYAGHGWLDKEADEGYWMPIDAEEEDAANWISSGDIIAAVRRSKAKHVMVVADSCFSGTLTRGLTIKSRTPDYLERMAKKRARTALTSGGLEPVMDSGGGNHSVFAQAFLSVLKENDAVLDGHQLFTVVRKKVMVGSEQTPEYGDLRKAGHDGGDFLFVKQ